ncbi:MAG TPA: SURF1 family protein [Steroidobacteraceae bacterium]|nr:SURF1 family protein [Steroidobacteraceae bacterium]
MPKRLTLGGRRFAPSPALTALMLVLCVAFIALGRWQWRRGEARAAEHARFERGARQVLALGAAPLAGVPDYQRVSVTGTYDTAHQFLIDNMSYRDLDGYHVLTPLERPGGPVVLVDRGWVPFLGTRSRLPDISLKANGVVTVVGRVGELPAAGLSFGRAPPAASGPWPRVTSFPTLQQLAEALGRPLEPRVILLDRGAPDGYVRDWHLPGIPALQNFGYAFQWWCFAIAAAVMWLLLSSKRLPRSPAQSPETTR